MLGSQMGQSPYLRHCKRWLDRGLTAIAEFSYDGLSEWRECRQGNHDPCSSGGHRCEGPSFCNNRCQLLEEGKLTGEQVDGFDSKSVLRLELM